MNRDPKSDPFCAEDFIPAVFKLKTEDDCAARAAGQRAFAAAMRAKFPEAERVGE